MEPGLISKAFVIGHLNAAVYRTENGLRAMSLDEQGDYVDCSRQASLLMDSSAEKRQLSDISLEELKQSLCQWSLRQNLLHKLIGAMDPQLREETRQLSLKLAEAELKNADAAQFARARLLSCPPPEDADLNAALKLSAQWPHCSQLFNELIEAKERIEPISQALQELVYFDFRSPNIEPDELYRTLVDQGVVAEAVVLSLQAKPSALNNLVIKFQGNHILKDACPRLAHLLTALVARLNKLYPAESKTIEPEIQRPQPKPQKADPIIVAVEQFLAQHHRDKDKRPSRPNLADEARQAADKQKTYISQLVKQSRWADAENALVNLVHNQARNGKPKHLCKSLCDLGQQFTNYGQYDLAKRVYAAAQLANPNDAVYWTGYAETLRELGELQEAKSVYLQARNQFSNDPVCWNGYAETLRELGELQEAKSIYIQATEQFKNDPVCWNGYAETLRELGELQEAKSIYLQARNQFSNNPVCWTGYAETLRELGELQEAKSIYLQARNQFSNNPVCWNGYAETLRELGELQEAKSIYLQARTQFSNDPVCWNGYAETLRELGQTDEAIACYRQTISRFPKDGVARNALACMLLEQEQYQEAEALLKREQPHSLRDWHDFHVLAMIKLKQGAWEEAQNMLEQGVSKTPSARSKQVFQTSLAMLELRRKRPDLAEAQLEISGAQIIQFPIKAVLRAHALAAQQREPEANELLNQIKSHNPKIIELADVLAKRYGLGQPKQADPELDREIEKREFALVLRAA